uniref:non-specific serine/threonine protein kinase n=1 Tax=Hyaloperonospora arabidopsidis (strain Emoy2) TaxID=559515 RepID=M4BQX3_HYAAE
MELSRMLKIFVQIASALMHVHSCRLIDRDLKPANIVVADVEREMRLLGGFGLLRDVANASSLNVATSLGYFLTRACFQWSAEHSFVNVDVVEHVGKQCRTYWCCHVILHKPKTSRRKSGSSRRTCTSTNDPFELCHDCFGRQWRGTSISVMPETASFLLISAAQRYAPEIRHAHRYWCLLFSCGHYVMAGIRRTSRYDHVFAEDGGWMEHCSGEYGGVRHLPNHNLLKHVLDVTAEVLNGKGALAVALIPTWKIRSFGGRSPRWSTNGPSCEQD